MSNISSAFTKSFRTIGVVGARRIVKFGPGDKTCALATAGTGFGVSADTDAADDALCDVALLGLVDVIYGGVVTRGDLLTSDAQGRAVAAAPGAGITVEIVGRALISGVLGDFGSVHLSPSRLRGA